MNVLVVGGGRIGSRLAEVLVEDGHNVVIVEKDRARCENLRARPPAPGIRIVCGDGNEPSILIDAGVREAQALAAATDGDEDNLVIGVLGKREFGVPRIVAKINSPANAWLFTQQMGIDAAVDPAVVIAKLLEEEASVGDVVPLLKMPSDDISLVQMTLDKGSAAVGRAPTTLVLPPNTVITAVIRGDKILMPGGNIVLQGGDQVIALCRADDEPALARAVRGGV